MEIQGRTVPADGPNPYALKREIAKITRYQTGDGKEHTTLYAAEVHQQAMEICQALAKHALSRELPNEPDTAIALPLRGVVLARIMAYADEVIPAVEAVFRTIPVVSEDT